MSSRRGLGWVLAVVLLAGSTPVVHSLAQESFQAAQGPDTERFLAEATMRLGKTLGGVTRARQAILELDGDTRFAVFKTIDERRTGAMPVGGNRTELSFQDSWRTEIPAYELDKLLGLGMVPATIERTFQGRQGSLQAWVELSMSEGDRIKNKVAPPDLEAWNQQIYKMRMFDNLIHNVDRHADNIQITKDWKVVLIDHSRAFRRAEQLFNEAELKRFSRSLLAAMATLDRPALAARMSRHLERTQIDSILLRRDLIVARARRLVAEQGEAAVLFP